MLLAVPSVVTNFQLPQRFQVVNGLSSIDAGVRILPFGAASTIGTFASTQMATKLHCPAIYLVVGGAALQTIGFVLLSMLKPSPEVSVAIYGYQVICGFGAGVNFMTLYLTVPFTAAKQDKGELRSASPLAIVANNELNCLQRLLLDWLVNCGPWERHLDLQLLQRSSMAICCHG